MDMDHETNYTRLCGSLAAPPVFSHSSRGQALYTFPLEIRRLSGAVDTVNILVRQSRLTALELRDAEKLLVEGQLRSFNNRRGEGARLVITVLARELSFCDEADSNLVRLYGTLCKPPNLRATPMGRNICDLMLAVNRRYGRSDYLPCIVWGLLARETADRQVGDRLALRGRIQSRRYIKQLGGEQLEKTAYEVSVSEIEKVD